MFLYLVSLKADRLKVSDPIGDFILMFLLDETFHFARTITTFHKVWRVAKVSMNNTEISETYESLRRHFWETCDRVSSSFGVQNKRRFATSSR